MQVLFRVDSGLQIGSGHVARCLTLADAITQEGGIAQFVCREHPGHLGNWISSRGFRLHLLPIPDQVSTTIKHPTLQRPNYQDWLGASARTDAQQTRQAVAECQFDWLVTDHYGIDATWERAMIDRCSRILAIDDLANRDHVADLLVDQNVHAKPSTRYASRLPSQCEQLLGPKYAILRPEFAQFRERSAASDSKAPKRLMLFMGGMDEHNVTTGVLRSLAELPCRIEYEVHVILGGSNPHREIVDQACESLRDQWDCPVHLHVQVSQMAELMASMDLAIAAGGTNTWERCCLGIPTGIISVAENQTAVARHLDSMGVAKFLGVDHDSDDSSWRDPLKDFLSDTTLHRSMATASSKLVDGQGVTRIAQHMISLTSRCAA